MKYIGNEAFEVKGSFYFRIGWKKFFIKKNLDQCLSPKGL